jgi:hypothetical protein
MGRKQTEIRNRSEMEQEQQGKQMLDMVRRAHRPRREEGREA